MKRFTLACLLAAGFAGTTLAAPETYQIDPKHTAPRFEYSHFGYSNQIHRFDKTSGTVTIDREAKTGAVDVTIDATSVNTGYDIFNGHIQEKDFFDTANFPTITFKSTKVTFDGDKPATVEGDLTIKGVTKPVTLQVTSFHAMPHPIEKKDAIGADATATMKRSEFNAGKYAPYVSDDVQLIIALEAIKP